MSCVFSYDYVGRYIYHKYGVSFNWKHREFGQLTPRAVFFVCVISNRRFVWSRILVRGIYAPSSGGQRPQMPLC